MKGIIVFSQGQYRTKIVNYTNRKRVQVYQTERDPREMEQFYERVSTLKGGIRFRTHLSGILRDSSDQLYLCEVFINFYSEQRFIYFIKTSRETCHQRVLQKTHGAYVQEVCVQEIYIEFLVSSRLTGRMIYTGTNRKKQRKVKYRDHR